MSSVSARPSNHVARELNGEPVRLLDLHEASRLIGVTYAVLLGEIAAGRLGACRVRGRWRLTVAQIEAWLKRIEKPARES